MSASVAIRAYRMGDSAALVRVFFDSVHQIARAAYNEEQLRAWAPAIPDPLQWETRMLSRETLVAECGERLVGFIELERCGHIDMLYRSPEANGLGVAAQLYEASEARARELGIQKLTTDASLIAEPFFRSRGYIAGELETVERNGVRIPRLRMHKTLGQ
ncbi:MAG TPA: GNAT family N-acetyltransferase [Terriglobia bacterium]|nr:GNAT family N-acetyltransferase [Terriglobia bacterium]